MKLILRYDTHLKEQLDPRNSILSGSPTNAQLVLYLLRAGEALGEPLPPPPELTTSAGQKALTDTAPNAQAGDDDLNEAKRKEANGDKVQAAGHRAKAGAKRHLAKAFRKVGRKVAGWHGDVAVDGKEKPVSAMTATVLTRLDRVPVQEATSLPQVRNVSGRICLQTRWESWPHARGQRGGPHRLGGPQ